MVQDKMYLKKRVKFVFVEKMNGNPDRNVREWQQ